MNPDTNRFEKIDPATKEALEKAIKEGLLKGVDSPAKALERLKREIKEADGEYHEDLVRPDGSPVPKTWSVFTLGEEVVIKDYTFKVAYIGETAILFEPVGPAIVGKYG